MDILIKHWSFDLKEKAKNIQDVTMLWCEDGWTYIPELKIRRQYFAIEKNVKMEQESWVGTIPMPLHTEYVKISTYSPQCWRETSEDLDEMFLLSPTKQNTSK